MKTTMHGAFLLFLSVLQVTWLNGVALWGIKPNLLMVYVMVVCFFCDKKEGAIVGAVFGLFLDIITAKMLGANMILGLLLGAAITIFCERLIRKNHFFITALVVIVASLIYESLYGLCVSVLIGDISFIKDFLNIVLPESIYNGIFSILLYFILKKLTKFVYADKGEGIG